MLTNYAVAAYAAIYWIGTHDSNVPGKRGALTALIVLICAYHIYALCNIQGLMTRLRLRLAYIYADYFSAERRERLQITAKPKSFWHQSGILIGLLSVSIIGALIVLLSIWPDLIRTLCG